MAILTLDPSHPTLDHHRPGEFPLFGTAMGIGALIEAAKAIGLCTDACRIDAIRVHAPYICDHPGPHQLTVDFTPAGVGAVFSHAQSHSTDVLHFECRIGQIAERDLWLPPDVSELQTADAVDRARIYSAFFHGPAFQVVDTAWFRETGLIARLSNTAAIRHLPPASLVIEFALQSAGLLELALSGRMLIPHAIDSIEIFSPSLPDSDQPIFACATQRDADANSGGSVIHVWALPGILIARIKGYRTVELPFAFASETVADLKQYLHNPAQ